MGNQTDSGASPAMQDRATAAEPVVSALRDGIPDATDLRKVAEQLKTQMESVVESEREDWHPWGIEQKLESLVWRTHRLAEAVYRGLLITAQAIETQSAKTAGLGPKDESAVGKADAP